MRVIVVGLGIQGKKRRAVAADDCVATVDPVHPEATYRRVEDVPLGDYDAALVCTPDQPKYEILRYLLSHGRHALVEKPLLLGDPSQFDELERLAKRAGVACYTAYNHRFEPHFINVKRVVDEGRLGALYSLRMFYGNGTAREVRNSPWRDQGEGVLPDLGSHLLDTVLFMLGHDRAQFLPVGFHAWENRSYDHVRFASVGAPPLIQLEAMLLSWRNTFTLDLIGEHGSAHIDCLCKWGPSIFTVRERVLPSGRPPEKVERMECADPTWRAEYQYFTALCDSGGTNLANDRWIATTLHSLAQQHRGLNQ